MLVRTRMRPVVPCMLLVGSVLAGCGDVRGAAQSSTKPPEPHPVAFYDVGRGPREIATGDFDGDTHADVAVANSGDGTVSVLMGDGSGRLRPAATFAAGREPSDVDAIDLDRDGDLDLIVANHETSGVTVLLNDGAGRFSPAPGSPFDTGARPHVHGLASGDFDGDGWADIAVESADTKEVRVLRGGRHGLAEAIAVSLPTMPYSRLGVGRPGGERRLAVIVPGHGDNTVRAIESVDGVLRPAPWTIRLARQPWVVVAGDLDNDGRDDVVAVETNGVSVWSWAGRRFVEAPGSPFAIPGATGAAIGDLDGNGVADVVVGPWDGDEAIALAIGPGGASRRAIELCPRPIGLAIADLDGDGAGEVLATCTTGNRLAVAAMPRF